MVTEENKKQLLLDLATAKGELESINGDNPRIEKQLKRKIARLERELGMIDLR